MNILEYPQAARAFDSAVFLASVTRGGQVNVEQLSVPGSVAVVNGQAVFKPAPDPTSLSAGVAAALAAGVTAEALGTSIDFSTALIKTKTLAADVTFTTANITSGKVVRARLQATGGARTITWPAGWVWAGTAPTALAQNKYALLTLAAFGTANTDIVATWDVQP